MVVVEFQNSVRNVFFNVGNSLLETAVVKVYAMDLLPIEIVNHYVEHWVIQLAQIFWT